MNIHICAAQQHDTIKNEIKISLYNWDCMLTAVMTSWWRCLLYLYSGFSLISMLSYSFGDDNTTRGQLMNE